MKTIFILILLIVFVSINVNGKKKNEREVTGTNNKDQPIDNKSSKRNGIGKNKSRNKNAKRKKGRKGKAKKGRNEKKTKKQKHKKGKGKKGTRKGKAAKKQNKKKNNKRKGGKGNTVKKDKKRTKKIKGKKGKNRKKVQKNKRKTNRKKTKGNKEKNRKKVQKKKKSTKKNKPKGRKNKERSAKKGKGDKNRKQKKESTNKKKRKNRNKSKKDGMKRTIKDGKKRNKVKDTRKIHKIKEQQKNKFQLGTRQTNTTTSSTTGCPDLTCVVNAASAIKIERDQVKNFFKQKSRIEGQMNTMKGKLSKKGQFSADAKRLLEAIGGNVDNATCGASSESAAVSSRHKRSASLAKTTYETLSGCDASIKTACPKPELNNTVANQCNDLYKNYQNQSKTCMDLTGDKSCSCFAGLVALKPNISACKIKDYATEIKADLKKCKTAFGKCKKAQDLAVGYVSTCTQSSESILENLKTLGDNEEATNQVLAKINETINDNNSNSSSNSTRRRRATTTVTVTEFTTRVSTYTSTLTENLYASSTSIANNVTQTVITGTVSSSEITLLTTSMTSVNSLLSDFATAKSVLQAQYKTLTGSFATTDEIRVGSAVAQGGTNSVIRKLKILTLAKGAVESVKAKVSAVLAGTSTNSTSNKMTGKYFKAAVKNYVSLVKTDYFSMSIRFDSLELASASVTVSSASIKTSLTAQVAKLTKIITAMEEKLTILQKQVKTLSGSTANTFQVYSGNLVGTKETASSASLEKLKILTKNKAVCSKVVTKMSEAVAGTASTGTESSSSDFKTACSSFVSQVKTLSISTKIVAMSASITTLKVTLSSEDKTAVTTLKTNLETEIVKIEEDIKLVKESFKTVTDADATDLQILTGKSKGTKDDAVMEAVKSLKILAKNEKALTLVEAKLTAAIDGKATTGTDVESATFVSTVTAFITLASADIMDMSIATQAASITIAKVSLSTADSATITAQKATLTGVIAQITAVKELQQSDIKTLISKEATSAQIISGDINGNIETAKKEVLLGLKALTMTSKAVEMVAAKITTASSGSATTGTEITGAAFVTLCTKFLTVTKKNYFSQKITAMAMKIELSKVTLSSSESTSLATIKTSISELTAKVAGQLAIVQETFKEFAGMDATEEEIKMAGSSKSEPAKDLNTGRPEVSAADTALMDLKKIKSNKEACDKVKTFLTGLTEGTTGSDGTDSVDGVTVIKRIAKLTIGLEKSLFSATTMSLYISIVSVKVTLTTNQKTQIKSMTTTKLQEVIEKLTAKMESLQFEIYSEEGKIPTDIQIAAGSKTATKESASAAILSDIKFCSMVLSAVTAIITDLDLALAGTATTGTLELTGEAYSTAFASYLKIANEDLMASSLFSLSFGLTSVKVALSAAQITTLTASKTEITTVKTRMESLITVMKAEFKTINGAEATDIQIAAGDSTVTDANTAASSLMKSLQIITVNKKAIEKVQTTLESAATGSITTGDEVKASVFMESLTMFFSQLTMDLDNSVIAALSFSITEAKVTLTPAQITTVKEHQTTIATVIIKITTSLSFMQKQVKALTGKEATEDQILVGDNSASVASVKATKKELYTSINKNKVSLETVLTLIKSIKTTGISVTQSGSSEKTAIEMFALVLKFSMMISGNFDSSLSAIMIKIETAKITNDFSSLQLESMTVFIERFEVLVIDIKLTLKLLYYQVVIMTGEDKPFDKDIGGETDTTDDPDGQGTDDPDGQVTDDPDGQGTDDPDGQGTDDPDGQKTDDPDGQGTDGPDGTTDPMSTPNILDLVKKLKALTMSKADVKSVTTKLTSLIDGTSTAGTANKMTEDEFKVKIETYVTMVTDDMSSSEIRAATLEITSASVTITSAEIKTSLTTSKDSLTTLITKIEKDIEETQEKVKTMSGSTASTYQVVTGTLDATKESAANGELDKLKQLSKAVTVSGKVTGKMGEALGDTAATEPASVTEEATEPNKVSTRDTSEDESTEFEGTSGEFKTACTEFVSSLSIDISSITIIKMSLSILSMKVTLTTEDKTEIRTLRTSLETETKKMEMHVVLIKESFVSVTTTTVTDVQILTGKLDGTEDDVINDGIQEMQTAIKNRNACKQVESVLTSAIAGTATGGTATTSAVFVTLVTDFVALTTKDVLDLTIVTSSTSITIATVTLSTAEITTITEQKSLLTASIAQLSTMKSLTAEFVKIVKSEPLSDIEIAAGKVGADINSAKAQILLELKSLTFSSQAITMISAKITKASSGEATSGTEISGEKFISMVDDFLSKATQNFLDVSLTSIAMVIELSKVTLTSDQVTSLSSLLVEVNALSVRVEAQISIVQVSFVSIVGVEASAEEITAAGSSAAKPSKGINTGTAEVFFADNILMDLKLATSNKKACDEIKDFLDIVIGSTSGETIGEGSETINSATFIKRLTIFVKEIKMSAMAKSISTLQISIMSVKFELESNLQMVVMEMKTSLEKIIETVTIQINSLKFQFYVETSTIATDIQITSGSQVATLETASTALLVNLKSASLNKDAITNVLADLELALAGTASSGILEITSDEYSEKISSFLFLAGTNMLDASLLSLSFSLTNLKTVLSVEQITKLTILKTELTVIITRIEILIVNIKLEFKTIAGAEATDLQIAAGNSAVADADAAASTFMKSLQIISVNNEAIKMVQTTLSGAATGALTEGEEVDAAIFMEKVEGFFSLLSGGYASSVISVMSFALTSLRVTLSAAQITMIEEYQVTISKILIQISISIIFHQKQIKVLTGSEATELQISVGNSIATIESVKLAQIELYNSIDTNIASVETVWTLIGDITGSGGISVTGSGSVEMTASEFYLLIVKFLKMVIVSFIAEIAEITTQITTAKITSELSSFEIASISDFKVKIEKVLIVDMKMTLKFICFQLKFITGGDILDICKPSSASSTMTTMPFLTTRGPSMMTTRGPSSSIGQESSSPERRRIRLNDKLRSALLRSNMKKLD